MADAVKADTEESDFEVMKRARLRWCRELGYAGAPAPSEATLAAYHRGFNDALHIALCRVVDSTRE